MKEKPVETQWSQDLSQGVQGVYTDARRRDHHGAKTASKVQARAADKELAATLSTQEVASQKQAVLTHSGHGVFVRRRSHVCVVIVQCSGAQRSQFPISSVCCWSLALHTQHFVQYETTSGGKALEEEPKLRRFLCLVSRARLRYHAQFCTLTIVVVSCQTIKLSEGGLRASSYHGGYDTPEDPA